MKAAVVETAAPFMLFSTLVSLLSTLPHHSSPRVFVRARPRGFQ